MHILKMLLGAALTVGISAAAHAQAVTVNDPPGPVPDASHIPFVLPQDIQWGGQKGVEETSNLYGDPNKPGPYGILIKWFPGHFSKPHFHDHTRWIYVVSGTWWVSSSNVYDEKTTYPLHAGTFSTDVANTIHWDGARSGEKEPAVILLTGVGPVTSVGVDENGKPRGSLR